MTIKNILFAITLCSYCTSASSLRPVPSRYAMTVAKNYADTLGIQVTGSRELIELETQTEIIGNIRFTCPLLFSFKTSDQKSFLIKIVNQRATQEILGAQRVRSFFPNAGNADNVSIISFSYCELYRDGKLTPLGDVANLPPMEFTPEDWLFEVMPLVPGVTLKKLIRSTEIISEEKRLNMFKQIGIFLNDLNYHKNFCHGSLHLKNIIGDPVTGNISLIDWDHCFSKKESREPYTDAELIFWNTFCEGILIPIMQSSLLELGSKLKNFRNLADCIYSLLSYSLGKDCRGINIYCNKYYLNQLLQIIDYYGKNIDDDEFDQKISMTCRFLKPLLQFFIRNCQVLTKESKEEKYYERASALFFTILVESDVPLWRIRDMEQKLKLPQKRWHSAFLAV